MCNWSITSNGSGGGLVGSFPVAQNGYWNSGVLDEDDRWVNHRARYWYNPGSGAVYGDWTPWFGVKCFQPPAPLLSLNEQIWDGTTFGYADVYLNLGFNHANLPQAEFDLQLAPGPNGTAWEDLETVGSYETGYGHLAAYTGQSGLTYRMRYRNGGVTGPWSASFNVDFDD